MNYLPGDFAFDEKRIARLHELFDEAFAAKKLAEDRADEITRLMIAANRNLEDAVSEYGRICDALHAARNGLPPELEEEFVLLDAYRDGTPATLLEGAL